MLSRVKMKGEEERIHTEPVGVDSKCGKLYREIASTDWEV